MNRTVDVKQQTFGNRASTWRFVLWLGVSAAALGGMILVSAGMGYVSIHYQDVFRILVAKIVGSGTPVQGLDTLYPVIVTDVRLPRILSAAVVGGGLAVSGVVFQGILLNPLADPYTLGVSAGAAFGAAVALLFGSTAVGIYTVPVCAFIGAILTLMLVVYLSASSGGMSSHSLILSGIIVTAILSAGISFLKYVADERVSVIVFWLMGSFAAKTWPEVIMAAVSVTAGSLVIMFYARDLNLISLGSRTAASLGVNTRRVPALLLVVASLVAAVCVCISGIIGFVGLLIPHMMRLVTGPDNRKLIPLSFFAGAVLLLAADTVTRAVLPQEIPIGVLTALIGGPVFCYIFRKRQVGIK